MPILTMQTLPDGRGWPCILTGSASVPWNYIGELRHKAWTTSRARSGPTATERPRVSAALRTRLQGANLTKQVLRMIVLRMKILGGFRSGQHARHFAMVRTVLSNARGLRPERIAALLRAAESTCAGGGMTL